ncbi:hypothetical protein CRE_06831 [Caenorhabditis remanei]|uniref:Sdz-33 F-box domain-containing protein n=1 Tax=Caenorhabditis remanei TaxID=31234 RepID=E3MZQ5_CAERE|nr:hypothetical protein CRE_06831 [Caenorhabditis remanei]
MNSPSFPLYRLTEEAINLVLWNMELIEQIVFATLSQKSRKYVSSLKLSSEKTELRVERSFDFNITCHDHILRFEFVKYGEDLSRHFRRLKIVVPNVINFHITNTTTNGTKTHGWRNWSLDIRYFVGLCLHVLHRDNSIDELVVNYQIFAVESLQQAVEGLDIDKLLIGKATPRRHMKNVIKCIKPMKWLQLDHNPFTIRNDVCLSEVLIQNLNRLVISHSPHFSLDDLLLLNASNVVINNTKLKEEEFNKFLKHWIAGSNPRLEYLAIGVKNRAINMEVLWKGIRYWQEPESIGYKIRRKDGADAIVQTGSYKFIMIVS